MQPGQPESEFARFFTHSPDLLCVAGMDGYFKRLNPAWTSRLGWTLEELKTRPFLDFVHPDDRAATREELVRTAAGADTVCFDNRYRRADGSYRWLRWTGRPVPALRRVYGSARDVTRQKRLEREILDTVDCERERLGQELHDGLCQTLAGIAALSSTLAKRLAASPEAAMAAEISGLLNGAITDARGLSRGLDPVCLREGGLDQALATLAANVRHLFRVACTFECDGAFPAFRGEAALHLFRITQEAVHNAVGHGRARHIEIGLELGRGRGLLSIRDDGVGLPAVTPEVDGIGLHTMAYRSRLIGARLELRRRARRGTAVICTFPLLAATEDRGRERASA